jgi:hypothetical protein
MGGLEQYQHLMFLSDEYSELRSKEHQRHDNEIYVIKNSCMVKTKKTMIVVLLVSIVIGCLLGEFVFISERKGANTVCYTTTYGDCYHASYCGSLYASSHKTTVFDARRNGYRDCSKCSVGELDISYQHHYLWSIIGSVGILSLIAICILLKKRSSLIEVANSAHEKNAQDLFLTYSNQINTFLSNDTILTIADAPQHIYLYNNEIASSTENLYKYVSYSGQCYHDDIKCSGGYYRKAFKYELKGYYACSKCSRSFSVPEWYERYKKLRYLQVQFQKQ